MPTKQVLAVDPECAEAHLRQDMVTQVQGHEQLSLRAAEDWYEEYNTLAPDDLLGLKRLTETCAALEKDEVVEESCIAAAQRVLRNTGHASRSLSEPHLEPAAVREETPNTCTDDRRVVAESSNKSSEEASESEVLLMDEVEWYEWVGGMRNDACFLGRIDELVQDRVWRNPGLWTQRSEGKGLARSGYNLELTDPSPRCEKCYHSMSLFYRTEHPAMRDIQNLLPGGVRKDLPDTDGRWLRRIFTWPSSSQNSSVILRIAGIGDVRLGGMNIIVVHAGE